MHSYKDQLYALVDFSTLGNGLISKGIARYSLPSTGVNNSKKNNTVKIYPNPSDEEIELDIDQDIQYISISDLQGRQVLLQNYPASKSFTISMLPQGMYILVLTTPSGEVYRAKFIKE